MTRDRERDRRRGEVTETNILREVASLAKRKRALEDELKKVKADLDRAGALALEHFANTGTERATVDGVTIFPRVEKWARLADGHDIDELASALEALEIDPTSIVKTSANSQTLSALVREYGDDLPPALADILAVSEVVKLGTRGS